VERPAQSRENDPIGGLQNRAVDPAAENFDFLAKREQLDVPAGLTSTPPGDQREHSPEYGVDQRQQDQSYAQNIEAGF